MTAPFAAAIAKRTKEHLVIDVEGELDVGTAGVLREVLLAACVDPPPIVVVDCARLTFIDSTGIGLLASTQRRLASAGARIVLTSVAANIAKVFQITGVDTVITINPD